jgi:uncharacterized protein YbjT (DUF2867 family)
MRVLVLGASGKVGRLLVPDLVHAGHEVTGVVRRPEAADEVAAAGARPLIADLEADREPIAKAMSGVDAVVWVAGANVATGPEHSDRVDREANVALIEQAQRSGPRRWIQVSSLYADRIPEAPPVLHHFLGNKAKADEALVASDLDYAVVRAAGLTADPGTGLVTVMSQGMGYGQIPRADLSATLVHLVSSGQATRQAFDLASGVVPIDEAFTSASE